GDAAAAECPGYFAAGPKGRRKQCDDRWQQYVWFRPARCYPPGRGSQIRSFGEARHATVGISEQYSASSDANGMIPLANSAGMHEVRVWVGTLQERFILATCCRCQAPLASSVGRITRC